MTRIELGLDRLHPSESASVPPNQVELALAAASPTLHCVGARIVAANEAAARLLGVESPEHLRDRNLDEFACDGAANCDDPQRPGLIECWHALDGSKLDVRSVRIPLAPAAHEEALHVMIDLSGPRRVRADLLEKQERLRETEELAGIGHWTLDLRSGELRWSEQIYRIFEHDPETFAASYEAFLERVHPEDRAHVDRVYRDSVETRAPYDIQHRLRLPDGRCKWVHERGRTFYDERGNALRSLGTVEDVTHEVEREGQLQIARHALESSCAGIAICDVDGAIRSTNPAFDRLFRIPTPCSAVGHSLRAYWPDAESFATLRASLATRPSTLGESRLRRADGSEFVAEYVASLAMDTHGEPLGMLVHVVDVSARHAATEALAEQQRLVQTVLDASPDWIFVKDLEHRFGFVNHACARGMGLESRDFLGRVDSELFGQRMCEGDPEAGHEGYHAADRRAFGGETVHVPYDVAILGDGRPCVFDTYKHPLRDPTGQIVGLLCYSRDITERTEMERRLAESEARLRLVFDHISDQVALLRLDADGSQRVEMLNARMTESFGTLRPDLDLRLVLGTDRRELMAELGFPRDLPTPIDDTIERALASGEPAVCRARVPKLEVLLDCTAVPVFDPHGRPTHVLLTFHDVTLEAEAAEGLRATQASLLAAEREAAHRVRAQLEEKEVLLREVHHRVKNNLQVVSSLLYLQQLDFDDTRLAFALESTRGRIAAMALVHEKLYSADDLGCVDVGDYANDLGLSLFALFGVDPSRIAFDVRQPAFALELERAIPCGLILNELLTNALKHAFPNDRTGRIEVAFAVQDSEFVIEVGDDGVGWPRSSQGGPTGLGSRLMPRLAAQLGGALVRVGGEGSRFALRFPRFR